MTALHLLALAGYFMILAEYIAMRHRVICAESDVMVINYCRCEWELMAAHLYWNRGTK